MKILTDCAADLTWDEAEDLGVTVAPLYIQFPEGEMNSADLSPDEFYDRLQGMLPNIPTTAQPAPGIFENLYRKLAEAGEEILSIHISSGLSGTIQSAQLGAKQVANTAVTVFDSMTLSGAQRFQVLTAALANKAGWAKEAIIERLERVRENTEVIYTLDTLEYLAHGGRIGRVQALASSLLNIKPVIRVDRNDGKYSTVNKGRTLKKTMTMMADHLAEMYQDDSPVWVSVMHGQMAEKAEEFTQMLKERLDVAKIETLRISPVLGVHTGPGIVGATVVPMRLMAEFA
ncbi:MAG: DegV family protein [Anaerolineales bacterium]|nr:DegV family protein [Chloroflexota bacterium]MBL6981374.1 DegV family protein [Anaerolineales bacterium]